MSRETKLLPVEDAVARILREVPVNGAERTTLLDIVGRVLALPLVARRRLPAWDNSAMDGYAVRCADLPTPGLTLPLAGAIAAGDSGETPLPLGAAFRILTGAPVPPGADAVVIQEDTERVGDAVTFRRVPREGENIRTVGSDVEPGTPLLPRGHVLSPGDVALLAGQGYLSAAVHRAPVVAIVSSGSELVEVDASEPARGQIANSNAWALAAAVQAAGALPRILPMLPDRRDATDRALAEAAATADVLLTSGGVSVGDHDHVGPALKALCGEAFSFWKVGIRPGKPLIFGHIGACTAFGLPGNPGSALVAFEVFVRPALLRRLGHTRVLRRPVPGTLTHPLPKGDHRQEYVRAVAEWQADGSVHFDARRTQSSGALSSLGGAGALVVRPPDDPALEAGARVSALLLGPDEPGSRLEG